MPRRTTSSGRASRSPCAAPTTAGTSGATTRSARRRVPRCGSASARCPAGSSPPGWCTRCGPGDEIEVLTPKGRFTTDLSAPAEHVFVVAGSGITPVLSLAATALEDGESTVTVFYGNRRTNTVMFADELADLKDRHGPRLQLVHVLSREPRDAELHQRPPRRAAAAHPRRRVRRRRERRPLVAVRPARHGRRRAGAPRRAGGAARAGAPGAVLRRRRPPGAGARRRRDRDRAAAAR